MNLVWESVRLSVCRRCIDGDSHGACRLPTGETCPLEAHFPIVAETVGRMKGRSMQSYVLSIRTHVCSQCRYGSADACRRRDGLECALERYAPLIVETIEGMRK